MSTALSPVISAEQLRVILTKPDMILLDARSGIGAVEKYMQQHIAGARYIDLEQHLAHKNADASQGGRHPLPTPERFAQILEKLGINTDSHIVVYDDKNGTNAAARCWWMLRSIGHQKVQVLDGGLAAAIQAGVPLSDEIEAPPENSVYPASNWQLPVAYIDSVEKAAADGQMLVIDVREEERYRGDREPIDQLAGHIPGAVNIPYFENMEKTGHLLPPEALKTIYEQLLEGRHSNQVIVHCGSGVTACYTLLAMSYAGLDIPALYTGSWSEWSRSGKPISKSMV